MIKLVAFDVDNTLAVQNKNILYHNVPKLRKLISLLVDQGGRVMLLSGKPTAYLAGFARQIGEESIIISGENGLEVNFTSYMPPEQFHEFEITDEQKRQIKQIKKNVENFNCNYYYQANKFGLTPFFQMNDTEAKDKLYDYARRIKNRYDEIDVYFHADCVDFTPKNINKGKAITYVMKELNIAPEEVIAVGDGENDIPMFNVAKTRYLIDSSLDYDDDIYHYKKIEKALEDIIKIVGDNNGDEKK